MGNVTGPTDGMVVDQSPNKGQKRPFGTPIDLVFENPPHVDHLPLTGP